MLVKCEMMKIFKMFWKCWNKRIYAYKKKDACVGDRNDVAHFHSWALADPWP